MKSRTTYSLIFCLLGTLLVTDIASAQLFRFGRRRWERRKQEIRSELSYQLNAKLEQDVETVRKQLQTTAEEQIAEEAARLQNQVKQEIANLRKHASEIVAAESERLKKQTAKHVAELREEAAAQVKNESARIEKQVATAVAVMKREFGEQTKQLETTIQGKLAALPKTVSTEVRKQVDQRLPKPKPAPDKSQPVQLDKLKATEQKPVQVEQQKDSGD